MNDLNVITPETTFPFSRLTPSVFLAGSIEQGTARDWQVEAAKQYREYHRLNDLGLTILSPRRANWDANLRQSIDEPVFNQQVTFELQNIEVVDAVLMWFEPGTLSPITLAEHGFLCGQNSQGAMNRLIVGCPDGFWRKGNVEMMCDRYNVPLFDNLEEAVERSVDLILLNYSRRVEFRNSLNYD